MRRLIVIFIFFSSELFSQNPCKKIILKACVNHESLLHIKNGILTWEEKEGQAPGTNRECGSVGITRISGKEWKDWKTPYKLDFNTNGLEVKVLVLLKHDKVELTQTPSASNGWETIYRFFDPSDLPHSYSISFTFCPPGYKPKEENTVTKKDSIKPIKPEIKPKTEEIKENVFIKVVFEQGKNVLTKNSESELSKLCEKLNQQYVPIEISGAKSVNRADGLKLYEERSITINNFLLKHGIDQKRIKYYGYGDNDKKVIADKNIKCFIEIN